jgi:glutathione synthase
VRKDPPFDMEYVYGTYLLELAEKQGARVQQAVRHPRPQREAGDRPVQQFTSPTLVTRDAKRIRAFQTSTRTSSSSRWTAWAAPASSASRPMA